jgi:hypothetical protein
MFKQNLKLLSFSLFALFALALSLFTMKSTAFQPLSEDPTRGPDLVASVNKNHASSNLEAGLKPAVQSRSQRIETELVTLYATGFEPLEITRPQGAFILGVDNRTGLENIELRLDRDSGGRVGALQDRKRRLSWRDLIELGPGRYVLSEANHPEWSCIIVITRP